MEQGSVNATFTDDAARCPLIPKVLDQGAWVFDPVSLKIAATEASRAVGAGGDYPSILASLLPEEFADLTELSVSPMAVSATIRTGLMRWRDDVDASELYSYADTYVDGLEVGEVECITVGGHDIIAVPMILPQPNETSTEVPEDVPVAELEDVPVELPDGTPAGTPVLAWFAEYPVPDPNQSPEGVELLSVARDAMVRWCTQLEPKEKVLATVPALDLDFENGLGDLPWETKQIAKIRLDENGAEVTVTTCMCLGVPSDLPPMPRRVDFGERSAVLMWFTSAHDPHMKLPFALTLTTEPSWIAE